MKKLIFALHNITSLREELSRGFAQISLASAAHRRPISITLRRSDGTGLRVRCRMHDVGERVEYGVLELEPSVANVEGEANIALPDDLGGESSVEKLVLSDDRVVCESGFVVRGSRGSELIVVAGAYPYTVAVSVAGVSGPFEPEFPMEEYKRIVLA